MEPLTVTVAGARNALGIGTTKMWTGVQKEPR